MSAKLLAIYTISSGQCESRYLNVKKKRRQTMINAEDLRIGDIVQTNKDCMFPKNTLCIVTEIHPDRQHNDKKGVVSLKAVNDDDDGPWGTWCCNIDGVPVTPEILRNNGFKEEVEGKYFTRPIKARAGSSLARYLQKNSRTAGIKGRE